MKSFFLPMTPPRCTDQSAARLGVTKDGTPYRYRNAEGKVAKQKLFAALWPNRPETPQSGPIRLTVKWIWKDESGKHKNGEPKITRPDTDNLQKMLKDVMTETGFWNDDAQVAEEQIGKYWDNQPGLFIMIESI